MSKTRNKRIIALIKKYAVVVVKAYIKMKIRQQ